MRIQHNIAALNAHRYLSANNDAVAKNLEKLSSGYRINRAGDDAAGLSISEKMRAQITGLETAKKNAQDGVSLVQTAEGNLTEVHSMLNRMVELSTQAANGTYQDLNRTEIQKEITSLTSEIDRISSSANFNGIKLLDGSLGGAAKNPAVTAASINGGTGGLATVAAKGSIFTTAAEVKVGTNGSQTLTVTYQDETGQQVSKDLNYTGTTAPGTNAQNIAGAIRADAELNKLFTVGGDDGSSKLTIASKSTGVNAPKIISLSTTDTKPAANVDGSITQAASDAYNTVDLEQTKADDTITIDGKTYQFIAPGGTVTDRDNIAVELGTTRVDNTANINKALKETGIIAALDGTVTTFKADPNGAGPGLKLQIGESNDAYQQVSVNISKMDSKSLGLADLDLTSQNGALAAIDVVTKAIDTVSGTRGGLGAIQNRLEHTINNLSVTDENMSAAESRIRDVDMAKEMMDFTKNNILTQAAQSMLAQANTLPQGVLQLLR